MTRALSTPARLALPALAAVLALALAAPARAAIRPAYGGEATAGAQGPLERLDPALARTDAERLRAAAVACTVPELLVAAPEVSSDGRTVRLRLRDNLSFHDGIALRADDVVRSLVRLADPKLGAEAAWRLLAIRGVAGRLAGADEAPAVRAAGPLTVEVELAVAGVDLLRLLDDPRLPVLRADGTGCGAYRPGASPAAPLTPFERHPSGRPYLDRLTVLPLPAGGGERALDVAEVDLAVDAAARRRGGALGEARHAAFLHLQPRGPVPVNELRLGLGAAIDREALVRFLVGGGAAPLTGLIPACGTTAHRGPGNGSSAAGDASSAPGDAPSAAGRAPAALPTGTGRMRLSYDPADPVQRRVAERIQVRLHDLGSEVGLVARGETGAGRPDLGLVSLPGLPADPGLALVAVVHRFGGPAMGLEALTGVAQAGDDPEALQALADRLAARLPVVPLYVEPGHVWARPAVMGVRPAAAVSADPADLWRWPLPGAPPADTGR